MTTPTTARHSQVVTSRGTKHLSHESANHKTDQISSLHQCKFAVRWQNHQCATWSDKATRRLASAGVIMRGGHGLTVWTKKQQVLSLFSAESELYAAVKTASEGLGIQSVAKDLGISCGLHVHLDASATVCLVNRTGRGKAKHVDMQNLWIQEASKSGRFVTKKVGTSVNPADLMTKPLPKPKIEQLMNLMGYEFMKTRAIKTRTDVLKGRSART